MAQHGYLGDGYGTHGEYDPDRGERDRDRDHDRERGWRGESGMMFGGRDRDRSDADEWFGSRERGGDRGSWPQRHQEMSRTGGERGFGSFGERSDWERGRTSFGSNQDDHYRSWRDKKMAALDSDYADYCREREQQFHSDFDDWRRQRRGNPEPLQAGRTQSGQSLDPSGMTQAENEANEAPTSEADALSTATLGTSGGRRR